jgi:acyl-CoA synthetase (NDP forming)
VQTFESEQGLMERDPASGQWRLAVTPEGDSLRRYQKPDNEGETASRHALEKAREIEREIQRLSTEKEQKAGSTRNVGQPELDEHGRQKYDKQNRPIFNTVTESGATQEELTAYDKRIAALRKTQDDYVNDASRARVSKRLSATPPTTTRLEFEDSDVPAFAQQYFGGDQGKARTYLKDKGYSVKGAGTAQRLGGGSVGTVTREHIERYARSRNLSYEDAKKQAELEGYKVQEQDARRLGAGSSHPSIGKIMQLSDGRKIRVKKIEGYQVVDYDVIP